jgi:hypothetical protein
MTTMTNDELVSALSWVDDRLRHTGTAHDYHNLYLKHLNDLLVEQLRRAVRPREIGSSNEN